MLHLLKHTSKAGEFYYLVEDKEYVVGRKNADIIITDDQSISRKHAIIKVRNGFPILVDCGSKYGTLHNGSKLTANKEIPLTDGDKIKFGVFQSAYKMEAVRIVTTGSGLTNDQKIDLKRKISSLGGAFLNNWENSCTAVTCQAIMLTIKVLHALIDDKPIVTIKYWDQCVSCVKEGKPLPNPEHFKPAITEALINGVSLTPDSSRKVLFKNKIFVFPTEKIKNKMSELIAKTGGSSISWEKRPLTSAEISKSNKNYLFIHCDEVKEIPQSLKGIYNHLVKAGERAIPIQEIAMAIVHRSCDKDCNPKFNRIHSVFAEKLADSASEAFALAGETPSEVGSFAEISPKKELVIPESLDAELEFLAPKHPTIRKEPQTSTGNFAGAKRPEQEPGNTPSKRIKLDSSEAATSQAKKRKVSDDNEAAAPALKKQTLLTKRSAADDPLARLKTERDSNMSDDSRNRVPEPTRSTQEVHVRSFNETYRPSSSNVTWKSKGGESCVEKREIDPEFKENFERFKDVTVIEIIPGTSITELVSKHMPQILSSSSSDIRTKKNFKKFKKSTPLHRQMTIISLLDPADSKLQENAITVLSDDDEEEQSWRAEVTKPTKKRFNF